SALPSPGEAEAVCSAVEVLGARDVERIRAARLGCYVYTVNEPVLADRLIDWRVDGIFTDRLGLVRARVGRRAWSSSSRPWLRPCRALRPRVPVDATSALVGRASEYCSLLPAWR